MLNCNQPHCSEGGSLPDQKFLVSFGLGIDESGYQAAATEPDGEQGSAAPKEHEKTVLPEYGSFNRCCAANPQ